MSTKPNESVYELIQSLSKTEKRYFKLLSSRHTIGDQNNYVTLFDYLDKQPEYCETKLFEHFKGEAFLHKFSITKKRLYDHILTALTQYHSGKHVEATVYKLLHSATILFEKALYSQAKKVLMSAEKLAYKHQLTNLLTEVRRQGKRLLEIDNYFGLQLSELDAIESEDQLYHLQSSYEDQLWTLKSRYFHRLSHQGSSRNTQDSHYYNSLFARLESIIEPETATFSGEYLKNHIHSVHYFAMGNLQCSYDALLKNRALFLKNNVQIVEHPDRYFSIITNLIYTADQLGNFKSAGEFLSELRNVHANMHEDAFQDLKAKLFSTLASIELTYHTKRGDYELLSRKIPALENDLDNYSSSISELRKAFIFFKIATVQLATNQSGLALKSIRKLLNESDLDKKEDIVAYSHLLELLIQIENGNMEIISYLSKVSQRFLKAKNRFGDFEKELVSYCMKISQTPSAVNQKEKWHELLLKLQVNSDEPNYKNAAEYFDWNLWAEAKSTGKSFIQLSQQKMNSQLHPAA